MRPNDESDGQSKSCRHAPTAFATTATQNNTTAISQILSVLRVIACTFPSLMGVSGVLPCYHSLRWFPWSSLPGLSRDDRRPACRGPSCTAADRCSPAAVLLSPRSRMTFSTVSAVLILSTSLSYSVVDTCPPSPCAGLSPTRTTTRAPLP